MFSKNKPLPVALSVLLSIVLFSSCKKSPEKIIENETKLSAGTSVNLEIKKLKDSLTGARDDYERAGILTRIASIESDKGDITNAIKTSREAIKYLPNDYMSHYVLGRSYICAARYVDAMSELETSIALKPDFALSHFELANALYKEMKYREAETEYTEAIKLDSTLIQAYNNTGVICCQLGDYKKAEKAFKKVIELRPDTAAAYKNLGIIYDTRLKNPSLAIENYRKYLQLRPGCPERAHMRQWIRQLGG